MSNNWAAGSSHLARFALSLSRSAWQRSNKGRPTMWESLVLFTRPLYTRYESSDYHASDAFFVGLFPEDDVVKIAATWSASKRGSALIVSFAPT